MGKRIYSQDAVKILLEIERDHLGANATSGGFYAGNCLYCTPPNNDCQKLLEARGIASRESRIAVALILGGGKHE